MHQIGVVGLSYRHAGVEEVARFSLPRTEAITRICALRAALGAAEILYPGTCNRVEVVFANEDSTAAGDARLRCFARSPAANPTGRGRTPAARLDRRRRWSTCSCSPAGWIPPRPASRRSPRSCAAPGTRPAAPTPVARCSIG